MVRKITSADRNEFLRLSKMFYASTAVMHDIPEDYHKKAFEELMRSDEYAEGYILETEGKTVGFGLTAKTYSREAGGKVLWLEELFVLEEYRSCGLGKEFLPWRKRRRRQRDLPVSVWKWRKKMCGHALFTNGLGISRSGTVRW